MHLGTETSGRRPCMHPGRPDPGLRVLFMQELGNREAIPDDSFVSTVKYL